MPQANYLQPFHVYIEIKPKWGLYQKKYRSDLAGEIQREISGDLFVIKPLHLCLGKGVIITSKENLDSTLQTILLPENRNLLLKNPDRGYKYWSFNHDDSFLVEAFIESILFPFPITTIDYLAVQ